MYASCLTCHASLGRNTALPQLGVGARVAYAPDVGRLWVVCDTCGEWNLAPIENRWEAIEACERLYDSSVERGAADGVSKAKVDGLELVRIGAADELPTLRYGSRLRRRSRSHRLRQWVSRARKALVLLGASGIGALVGGLVGFIVTFYMSLIVYSVAAARSQPVIAKIPKEAGDWVGVSARELRDVRLVPEGTDGWSLRVRRGVHLRGPTAVEAVRLLLPLLNRSKDPRPDLEGALRYIDGKGGTLASVFAAASRRRGSKRRARIAKLEPHIRLALEILAARDVEERAIAFDLQPLKLAWKHAEELSAIEDDLTFSIQVVELLREGEPDLV